MAKAAKATTGAEKPTNLGGRPFIFKTPKALESAINEYFDWCDNRTRSVFVKDLGDNIEVSNPAPYTMAGLAYALGVDRQTLLNYEGRDGYSALVKRARQRVEQDVETRMNDKETFTPGLIFNAKNNFGWVDQTKTDLTTNGKELPAPILGGATREKMA